MEATLKHLFLAALAAFGILALAISPRADASSFFHESADARNTQDCGKVSGVPIHAHDVSCRTARHVYRSDMAGNLARGWSCSASLARCYHGEVGRSSEYIWWRRTTYRLERRVRGPVVLGGKVYSGPNGQGFGAPHPKLIYNGGDANGSIAEIHWSSWGGAVAHGRGRHPIFRPRGGYYRKPVVALLKPPTSANAKGTVPTCAC